LVLRNGFTHRRKTIANNFRDILSTDDWLNVDIDPKTRPEQLDYAAWSRLACLLH
jgi:16S rRNA (adenine1518-N6/adenine1519-N6)-dimethyltransferase